MNILFISDVFGKPGRKVCADNIEALKEEYDVELCIANCENAASGRGITEKTANELFAAGINIFTSGNHLWDKKESLKYIKDEIRIVKPFNYPVKSYGNEFYIYKNKAGFSTAIVTLCGQAFMNTAICPFQAMNLFLEEIKGKANSIIVDFHAESTAEKRAFGLYFDGKISAMIGTHTHIQTADEEILPNGTGYITDAGMTGPHDSVIGVKKEIIFKKILSGMPYRYETAKNGLQINGVYLNIDPETGKTLEIKRIRNKYDGKRT